MSKQNRDLSRTERAAKLQAETARKERNRKVAITGGILVVLAALVAGAFWATRGSSTSSDDLPKNLAVAADGNTLVMGKSSAPVKVVIHEDFQCPYCKQFESQSRDFLRTDAAEGKVQVTYAPFNLLTQDDYSARALSAWTTVLKSGTPAQALKLHDTLFEDQPYENASSKPDTDQLQTWAKDAGAKNSVASQIGGVDDSVVEAVNGAAKEAGISSTPTVTVDGKPLEAASIDAMVSSLEKQIAAAK